MDLIVSQEPGIRFIEGPPDLPFLRPTPRPSLVIESCLSNQAWATLLYASNLTAKFFDLSSGEAGAILQKLRNYRIRLAIVCPPGTVQFSSRFGEMVGEESRTGYFQVFESAEAARESLRKT